MNLRDTIVAISTPVGHGGLGVVRLSGSESRRIASEILRFTRPCEWQPWSSQMAELIDAAGATIDEVVVSFFARPRSYTAEDVVEFSCHGAPVILHFCLERAVAQGARLAEAGEFTLRAYANGRLDLPRAEAVADLIAATTLYQARVAAQQMGGSLSRRVQPLKAALTELIAILEAGIDFAEDDISVATADEILSRLEPVRTGVSELAATFAAGKLVFHGFTLAIAGKPNVGKSSLFNRLLERDRAIVTELPGTTRDTVSEVAVMSGLPVRLIDTAGIRDGAELVEKLGIERSYEAMADADLTVLVFDISSRMTTEDLKLMELVGDRKAVVVGNKCDLGNRWDGAAELLPVSAITGQGIQELKAAILRRLAPEGLAAPESGSVTNIRHEKLLRETRAALSQAREAVRNSIPHEMLLVDLYTALRPLDALTGATTADDILNSIFAKFCIGK